MKKPVETSTYTFDTTNPHKNIRGGDCVVRAISLATDKSWVEVFDSLVEIGRKKGRMPNDTVVYSEYLRSLGWEQVPQPRKSDNTKYTVREFVKNVVKKQRCIVHITHHLACCMEDGKIHDIWNCGNYCVGKYWIKNI